MDRQARRPGDTDRTATRHPGRFHHLPATAAGLAGTDRPVVTLDTGKSVPAQRVLLAFGHGTAPIPAAVDPRTATTRGFVADPWRPGALDRVPLDAPVLLLGTGLTAVDMALSLVARGLRAPIHAVSRHGLLSQSHAIAGTAPQAAYPPASAGLPGLLRYLRVRAVGTEWRPVLDGLRPHVDTLWRA